ncbi:MAG TPA: XRE family transcriptional regulator [Pirellulales bacterium]|jgi:transcriptional regulator with XRE-family HTH domain
MARTTKNLVEVIRSKLAADPDLADAVEHELFNASVATAIHDARAAAGLTQKELADRVGTYQSVIARLEDADYDGHSLKILNRIAEALGRRVEIRFVGQPRGKQPKTLRKKVAGQRLN